MDWHERTERQVGARGVDELRQWMALSAATDAAARPRHALAASMLVLVLAMATALVVGPTSGVASAAPLAPGTYAAAVEGGVVTITVHDDGGAEVIASDGLVVQLAFDDAGRVLDTLLVMTADSTLTLEVEVDADGYEIITSTGDPSPGRTGDAIHESGTDRDAVLGLVAACAPQGSEARALGLPNRGSILSAAASGLSLEVELGEPGATGRRTVHTQLATVAGAREFCDLVGGDGEARHGGGSRGDGAAGRGDTPSSSTTARPDPGAGQTRGGGAPDRTGADASAPADTRGGPSYRQPAAEERTTEPGRSQSRDERARPDPAGDPGTTPAGTQSQSGGQERSGGQDRTPPVPSVSEPSGSTGDATPPGHERTSSQTNPGNEVGTTGAAPDSDDDG